jgi:nucleoside-diphosphate-sugar epimerase
MDLTSKLVIGNKSQLSRYFPLENTAFISSRNINLDSVKEYDKVFFFFCEQRTFLNLTEKEFCDINVDLTLSLLEKIYNDKTKFYLYSTCELWNNCEGGVTINTPHNFKYTPYTKSKQILAEKAIEFRNKKQQNNIRIFYPFNFNTPYRTEGFLFSKIFNSLINNVKIETGDLDFNRDLVHPKFIIERSFISNNDDLIGSGNIVNIREFVHSLYKHIGMNVTDFLFEQINEKPRHNKCFYHDTDIKYNNLLEDTVKDVNKIKNN